MNIINTVEFHNLKLEWAATHEIAYTMNEYMMILAGRAIWARLRDVAMLLENNFPNSGWPTVIGEQFVMLAWRAIWAR